MRPAMETIGFCSALTGSLNEYELDLLRQGFALDPVREGAPRRIRCQRSGS